jgi:hypothetical protein
MAMKSLLWIASGAAVVGLGAMLFTRKGAGGSPPSPATPPKTYGETTKVTLAVPSGWRRVTNAEVSALPELGTQANALVNTPGFTSMQYGTLAPFLGSDGRTYATWVEQHFHEPGGTAKPWGLHHGVTLLERADIIALADEWKCSRA